MMTTATESTTARQTARAALDALRAVRESAEAALANLTAAEAPLRARRQALALDVRLGRAGAEAERDQVLAELAAVDAQLAEAREVVAAAAAREPEACAALRAATLPEAEADLRTREAQLDALVDGLKASRLAPAVVGEPIYILARQISKEGHDFHRATGDPHWHRKFDIEARLGAWSNLIPHFTFGRRGVKVPIPTPWRALLPDLEAAPTAPDAMR